MNSCNLMGNLTRDVELKDVGEHKLAKFGLAVNKKFKDKEEPMFIDCECWGNRAEVLANYFHKGSRILINNAELRMDVWEKDGEKRSKHKLVITDFHFVDRKKDSEESQAAPQQTQKQAPKKNSSPKKTPEQSASDEQQPPF